MPDKMISLLVGFLQQNNGVLSERAKEKEFLTLTNNEITKIETKYKVIFEKSAQ
jgi:hypothetical protein